MSEGEYEDQANKFRELMRTAWLPVTEEGDGPVTGSKFSGTPYLAPGESWPTCPRCGAPMALFLQLNLEALPEELGGELGSGLLQMFYCVSRRDCPIRGEGRLDPFSPYQLLRRVCPSPGGPPSTPPTFDLELPARRITGWEPVEDYPDRTEWPDFGIEADDDEADALSTLGYQPRQEDKLLGWPSWPQYVNYPNCRVCGRQLWQVFQLESHQNLWYVFGDDGNGHITCCPDHPDELAFQSSSY
jgi:Domain of unknown function (DUF1963)